MPRDENAPEDVPGGAPDRVEFLSPEGGGDASTDEELPQPDRPGALRSRRAQVGVGIAVAVLLVAILGVRLLESGNGTPAAAPTGSAAPTGPTVPPGSAPTDSAASGVPLSDVPDGGSSTGEVGIPRLPQRSGPDPEQCVDLTCNQQFEVPSAVIDAVRAAFPRARVTARRTVRLREDGQALWFRRVVAVDGPRHIVLQVQAHAPGDANRAGYGAAADGSIAYFEHELEQWQVIVRVTAPVGTRLTLSPLSRLVNDERVLSV